MTTTIPYDNMSSSSERQPLFKKCCFCFPLRVGCFILGYLALIHNIGSTMLLVFGTTVVGIVTDGFDHLDEEFANETGIPADSLDKIDIQSFGILLFVILFLNAAWLAINIVCLVGLHKRRPGPVKVYAICATVRLVFVAISFIMIVTPMNDALSIVGGSIDIALTAYFVAVYYVYAHQLEREREMQNLSRHQITVDDIAYIYPKIDKQHLVA